MEQFSIGHKGTNMGHQALVLSGPQGSQAPGLHLAGGGGVTLATWELFFTSGLFPQPRRRTQSRGRDRDWDQQASSAPFRSVW